MKMISRSVVSSLARRATSHLSIGSARFSTVMIARTGASSFSSSAIASSALLDNPKELGQEAIFSSEVNDRIR
jgi:hypothetical protein